MKAALVSALCECAGERQKRKARRFLEGLSADELQYIADFLGACILESAAGEPGQDAVAAFSGSMRPCACGEAASGALDDHDHKLILLKEYLSRCQVRCAPAPVRIRRAGCG